MSNLFNYSNFFEGWFRGKDKKETGKDIYIADMAQERALEFLQTRPKDKPFAVTIAFYPPKGVANTYWVRPEFVSLYQNVAHPEPSPSRAKAYSRLPPFLQDNRTEARSRYLPRFEIDGGSYQEAMTAQYATISHLDSIIGETLKELKNQTRHL